MSIRDNLRSVQARIANALERSGRAAESVTLVTVTKTVGVGEIEEVLAAGVRHLGENRVLDASPKIEALQAYTDVIWHMIGHLQTNKVKHAVELFQVIHSVDSRHLAAEIHKRAMQQGKVLEILFEVNVSGETSKFGLAPDAVLPLAQEVAGFDGLVIKGLMTMAPFLADPEETRPYFRKLRELLFRLQDTGLTQMDQLSMGMTNDFEVAIEEGATLVRIGTAIFGAH